MHTALDLTLSFMPICELRQLANKSSESQRTWKKGAFHLVSVSHFNSAYNPRGERTLLPAHRQLSSANREGLFFDEATRERAYWFSCDMHENHSRMSMNTCVGTRTILIGSEQKGGWKLLSPFLLIDDNIITELSRRQDYRNLIERKNKTFELLHLYYFYF